MGQDLTACWQQAHAMDRAPVNQLPAVSLSYLPPSLASGFDSTCQMSRGQQTDANRSTSINRLLTIGLVGLLKLAAEYCHFPIEKSNKPNEKLSYPRNSAPSIQGHSRSSVVVPIDRRGIQDFLLALNSNLNSIFNHS